MLEPPVPPRPELRRTFPHGSLIERARERWDDPRVRIGALLLGALIAGLAWYQLGVSGGASAAAPVPATKPTTVSTGAPGAPDPTGAPDATGPSTPAGGFVMVHVAGAVVHPGLVRIRAGARVNDAVLAAGGGVPGADLDRLNLAAKVADGQRIAVGLVGAPAPVEAGGTGLDGDRWRRHHRAAQHQHGQLDRARGAPRHRSEPGLGDHRRAGEARRVPIGGRAPGRARDR